MRKANYLKVAAALLAVGLLAKFVRHRFSHAESTGDDSADTWQRPTKEGDTRRSPSRTRYACTARWWSPASGSCRCRSGSCLSSTRSSCADNSEARSS